MMKIADMAAAPSQALLAQLLDDDISAVAGYIGGNTPSPWPPEAWRRCYTAGFGLLAIYVAYDGSIGHERGAKAGNDCLVQLQQRSLGSVVVLDIESGYDVDVDFVLGFSDALEAGECDYALYGKGAQIESLGPTRLWSWVASPSRPHEVLHDTLGVQFWYGVSYNTSLFDTATYLTVLDS